MFVRACVCVSSIAECCSTPYSLLGLVFTVSFIALGVLTLCKFYLQGYRAFINDNTMHRYQCVGVCLGVAVAYMTCVWLCVVAGTKRNGSYCPSLLLSLQGGD